MVDLRLFSQWDYIQTLILEGVFRPSLINVMSTGICNNLTRICLVLAFLRVVYSHIMLPCACNSMSDDKQAPTPPMYKLYITLANYLTKNTL
jgi:hypothetical protein